MYQPKKVKYYKQHRPNFKGIYFDSHKLTFGKYGLQVQEPCQLFFSQFEAARRIIRTYIKRVGRLWVLISFNKPITRKSENSRMGAGKGNVKFWVANVKPGKILFEIDDIPYELVKKVFSLASSKLPVKTRLIIKNK